MAPARCCLCCRDDTARRCGPDREYRYSSLHPAVAVGPLPGTSLIVNGAAVLHNSALTSVGAEMHLTQRWTLLGKFDGEFASSSQIYAGSGTLRYQW